MSRMVRNYKEPDEMVISAYKHSLSTWKDELETSQDFLKPCFLSLSIYENIDLIELNACKSLT